MIESEPSSSTSWTNTEGGSLNADHAIACEGDLDINSQSIRTRPIPVTSVLTFVGYNRSMGRRIN